MCLPDIILNVGPDVYDSHQWFHNEVPIPGATTPTFVPEEVGNYSVEVKVGSCPPLRTENFKVINCPFHSEYSFTVCDQKIEIIPKFSNSNQSVDLSSIQIIQQPTKGIVILDPSTGILTYTKNDGEVGIDEFIYKFCGLAEFQDCEEVKVSLNLDEIVTYQDTLYSCNNNGFGEFDLTTAYLTDLQNVTYDYYNSLEDAQNETDAIANYTNFLAPHGTTIYVVITANSQCKTITQIQLELNNDINFSNSKLWACSAGGFATFDFTLADFQLTEAATFNYYPTLLDAENNTNEILNFTNFTTTQNTTIYTLITTVKGCKTIAELELFIYPLAEVDLTAYQTTFCNQIVLDLDLITSQILNLPQYFTTRYYLNESDATAGNNNTLTTGITFLTDVDIFLRIDSPDGCAPIIQKLNFLIGQMVHLNQNLHTADLCDDDFDGLFQVDLNQFIQQFTTDGSVMVSFFENLIDAQNNLNSIASTQSVENTKTYYLRFEKNGFCANTATLEINIKTPLESNLENVEICINTSTILDPGHYDTYLWSTGETTPTIEVEAGNYWVDLTLNTCTYRHYIEVTNFDQPQIIGIKTENNFAIVEVTGGHPPYQYSLDNLNWSFTNRFDNLPTGQYTIYVRDANYCQEINQNFEIFNITNFITPNGDGLNDTWRLLLAGEENVHLQLFDRYGKIIIQKTFNEEFIWDGKQNGISLPSTTYWYLITLTNGHTINGNLTLKNK